MIALILRHLQAAAIRGGLGAALIVVWQILAVRAGSIFLPPPSDILVRSAELWLSGPANHLFLSDAVFHDIVPSVWRLLLGWCVAVALGVLLGVAIGLSRSIADFLNVPLQFLRSIPGPAMVPIFIILFGTESAMRVILIAFGSIWPVLLNTIDGIETVDPLLVDTARVFGLPRAARLARIMVPGASPKIFAGMRVSLALAVILMVVSELVASTNGIGYRIQTAQIMFLLTDVWSGIALLAMLGYALNWLFLKFENWALAWHHGTRARVAI